MEILFGLGSSKSIVGQFLVDIIGLSNLELIVEEHVFVLNGRKVSNNNLVVRYNLSKSLVFSIGKVKSGLVVGAKGS